MVSRTFLIALIVLIALATGACGGSAVVVPRGPEMPAPAVRPSVALLQSARQALAAADFERARRLLQRAQRVDARHAGIYLEFARLYEALGEFEQARTMAERGLLYCRARVCAPLRDFLR